MNICKRSRMNRFELIPLFLIILLLLASCRKAADVRDSIDARVEAIKDSAAVVEGIIPTDSSISAPESIQTVYADASQQQAQQQPQIYQNTNMFSSDYRAPCRLERFKVLNTYCGAKTYWQQQSEIISWRISYSLVLLGLVAALFALWWISRKLRG